ncbi:MAG: hypothetical protein ACTSWR_12360 [Candidatus Helarchaeota archaeon]
MEKSFKASIGFDNTQNERGKLEENYTKFKSIIIDEGHEINSKFEFPISLGQLSKYDIVFFACPDRSKFREFEIEQIIKYVKNGGNVVLLSNAGGDKGLGTNLNEIGKEFGITCNNDQICDDEQNYGIRTLPISQNFNLHPITTEIELLLLPGACSLNVSKDATVIVSSGEHAEPPNAPVIAVAEKGLGKFVFFGTYELFRDNIRGGIQVIQHRILLKNLLNWLFEDMEKKRLILNIQTLANAVVLKLKKKEKKEKGIEPIKIVSTKPVIRTPDGKISPESMLDQIIISLKQLQEISGNLNIIDRNITEFAREIKLLRNDITSIPSEMDNLTKEISNISLLLKDLQEEIKEIKIAKSLEKAIENFQDFKLNFESQIDIILNKNINPIKLEISEISESVNLKDKEIEKIKEDLVYIKENLVLKKDVEEIKIELIDSIKSFFENLKNQGQ